MALRETLRTGFLILAGGLIGGWVATKAIPAPSPSQPGLGARTTDPLPAESTNELRLRLRSLEQRATQLESRDASMVALTLPASSATLPTDHSLASRNALIERESVRTEAALDGLIADYQHERRDEAWAVATTQSLTTDFHALQAPHRFEIQAIDCRSSLCSVKIAWSSRQEAEQNARSVGGSIFHLGCAHTSFIENEERGGNGTSALVIFDCRASNTAPSTANTRMRP